MRTILYVESDDHGGNTRGLLNPNTQLPDDDDIDIDGNSRYYTPSLRKWQRYLWGLREMNLDKLVELAAGDPIVYMHTGDITQGDKYATDWVTTRKGDQFLIALANHRPIMELPNLIAARYVEGTSSHVFGDGTSEGVVTGQLKAEYPSIDVSSAAHGLIEVAGLTIDYTHHGPSPGSRIYLEGNAASYYLRDLMLKELIRGNVPPKLYLRGHFHSWVKAFWNVAIDEIDHTSMLCIVPPMCGLGAYGRQVTRSVNRITNGALAFEIIDGDILRVHRWTKTIDVRKREIVP